MVAFVDVDLRKSLETCVRYIWPKLHKGCIMFCHEAPHMSNVRLFFDKNWFLREFGESAPCFWGAGTGLPLLRGSNLVGSALGYSIK